MPLGPSCPLRLARPSRDLPGLLDRLIDAGGTHVTARNPYQEGWGVTVQDPDGYHLVLASRGGGAG